MPLEISEIGVHLAIGDAASATSAAVEPGSGSAQEPLSPAVRAAIVKACVDEVLRTLRAIDDR